MSEIEFLTKENERLKKILMLNRASTEGTIIDLEKVNEILKKENEELKKDVSGLWLRLTKYTLDPDLEKQIEFMKKEIHRLKIDSLIKRALYD